MNIAATAYDATDLKSATIRKAGASTLTWKVISVWRSRMKESLVGWLVTI